MTLMTPRRSQIAGWQTGALTTLAAQWTARAADWEAAFDAYRHAVAAPRGTAWTGAAADAALDRAIADSSTAHKAAAVLGAMAGIARDGAAEMDMLRTSALNSIADAAEAGFAVDEDLSVRDIQPSDPADPAAERARLAEAFAQDITRKADALLVRDEDVAAALRSTGSELLGVIGPARLGSGPFQRGPNGEVLIEGTDGDDTVRVAQDPGTGTVTVTVNGQSKDYRADEVPGMTIRTNGGDDTIEIGEGIVAPKDEVGLPVPGPVGFRIEAGAGNDRIRGGSGRDYINGSTGDDVIDGGGGNDVIYGGDGNDVIHGGAGNDFIDGGTGNDRLYGDAGNDTLHGGQGDDMLYSGLGNDVVITGAGIDQVFNDGGRDLIKAQVGKDVVNPVAPGAGSNDVRDTVLGAAPDNIVVAGDNPEFAERVAADLELYRSLDTGKAMLSALDSGHNNYQIVIGDLADLNSYSYPPGAGPDELDIQPDQQYVAYNPGLVFELPFVDPADSSRIAGMSEFTPASTLFHEMAHSYDFTQGTMRSGNYHGTDAIDSYDGIHNAERVAAGLTIDDDNNPRTPERLAPEHPALLTENAIRGELGLPVREHYGSGPLREYLQRQRHLEFSG